MIQLSTNKEDWHFQIYRCNSLSEVEEIYKKNFNAASKNFNYDSKSDRYLVTIAYNYGQ